MRASGRPTKGKEGRIKCYTYLYPIILVDNYSSLYKRSGKKEKRVDHSLWVTRPEREGGLGALATLFISRIPFNILERTAFSKSSP